MVEEDAKALLALANPNRLQMLTVIGPDGTTGDRLAARFPDISEDMFWWNMRWLLRADLVQRDRVAAGDRRSWMYRLNMAGFAALADRLSRPADHYTPLSDTPAIDA